VPTGRRDDGAMTRTDKMLAALAVCLFLVFLGIVIWFVREIDLIVVTLVVAGLAIYDFWLESRQQGGASGQ